MGSTLATSGELGAAKLVADGWDPTLAYLNLMLAETQPGHPLENLTNEKLRAVGAGLKFYEGLPGLFADLQAIANEHRISRPAVETYIVSGGLEEVIKGSSIAAHVTGLWGCCFHEEDGRIRSIRNVISFTEKTRYLYAHQQGNRE